MFRTITIAVFSALIFSAPALAGTSAFDYEAIEKSKLELATRPASPFLVPQPAMAPWLTDDYPDLQQALAEHRRQNCIDVERAFSAKDLLFVSVNTSELVTGSDAYQTEQLLKQLGVPATCIGQVWSDTLDPAVVVLDPTGDLLFTKKNYFPWKKVTKTMFSGYTHFDLPLTSFTVVGIKK